MGRRAIAIAGVLLAACLLAILALAAPADAQDKRIALTFDDVPRGRGAFFTPDERTRRLIAELKRAKVRQAAFFVVPGQIGKNDGIGGERRIAAYVAAGHVIANHSFTHPHLNEMTATAYIDNVDKAERWLEKQPGHRSWFRFPFLDEGGRDKAKRDALRSWLKSRGLSNGYATVDGSDWNLEGLTADAAKAGKPIDRKTLRTLYVETMVEAAEFNDRLARKAIGRAPAQVILLHETDLAALYIGDLVRALRASGWTIITADEAYADPIARDAMTIDQPVANGLLTEALAWRAKLPKPHWYERNDTNLAGRLYRERVLNEAAR